MDELDRALARLAGAPVPDTLDGIENQVLVAAAAVEAALGAQDGGLVLRADGRLVAHVWVRSGEVDVIGCEGAERYGLLAVFPPA